MSSDDDPKRCWICFEDENTSNLGWISPCKCRSSLKHVHEVCLLKWISEKQDGLTGVVKCPACGHPYTIEEAPDLILATFGIVDKIWKRLLPYIALGGVTTAIYVVCTTYGAHALVAMCGAVEAEEILNENFGLRAYIGLPAIPVALLSSRLRSGELFLPALPFLILGSENVRITYPPNFAMTVCMLPMLRVFYSGFWNGVEALDRMRRRRLGASEGAIRAANGGRRTDLVGALINADGEVLIARPMDSQRVILGPLLLPAISSFTGSLLSLSSYIRAKIPNKFHRNLLGGFLFVFTKDLCSYIYRSRSFAKRTTRRIKNFEPNNS